MQTKKRICIDLDGVICSIKKEGETYADVQVLPEAHEKICQLKKDGWYVIINTARHMKTCLGNQGLVQAKVAKITLDWLSEKGIPYDEVYFGKPWAQIYLDDNAFRFTSWSEISGDGSSFPTSNEQST